MKAWKFMLLAGGLVGLIGFFLPFMKVENGATNGAVGLSGMQMVKGISDARELLSEEVAKMPEPQMQKLVSDMNETLKQAGGLIMMFYIPTALVFLVGLVNTARKKMGRLAGLLGLIAGAAAILVWVLFQQVIHSDETSAAGAAAATTVTMGLGLHLILVSGLLGAIGGLGALVKPDRGIATMSRVA